MAAGWYNTWCSKQHQRATYAHSAHPCFIWIFHVSFHLLHATTMPNMFTNGPGVAIAIYYITALEVG
jgi:hypothetical protein